MEPRKLDVTAKNGVPFRVVLLPDGVSENFPKAHEVYGSTEPLVEFYDLRHPHTPDGQFTGARYGLRTLLGDDPYSSGPIGQPVRGGRQGLDLVGYEPSWKVDGDTAYRVAQWLVEQALDLGIPVEYASN